MGMKASSMKCKCNCTNCETRKSSLKEDENNQSAQSGCKKHSKRASPYCQDCKTGNTVPNFDARLLSRNDSFCSGVSSSGVHAENNEGIPKSKTPIPKLNRVASGFDLKSVSNHDDKEELLCNHRQEPCVKRILIADFYPFQISTKN